MQLAKFVRRKIYFSLVDNYNISKREIRGNQNKWNIGYISKNGYSLNFKIHFLLIKYSLNLYIKK